MIVGGTTAKSVSFKGKPLKTARVLRSGIEAIALKRPGMPISIPVVDMVEIGAGGGSLAHVDNLRQIRVGQKVRAQSPRPLPVMGSAVLGLR